MKKYFYIIGILLLVCSSAYCAILEQYDFTPAQNTTLPTGFTSLYDPSVDVYVTAYSNVSGTLVDHSGGDGFVLQLGDLQTGGGSFNWGYPTDTTKDGTTDSIVETWQYINLDTTAFPLERDFGIYARCTSRTGLGASATRSGYMLWITSNSAWSGYSPPNFVPMLIKREGAAWTILSAASTSIITNGWHKIKMKAKGSDITCYVDDTSVISVIDTTFTAGFSGIVYYDDNGSPNFPYAGAYDNFLWQSILPVSLPVGTVNLNPGQNYLFTATEGNGSYTWSLSTDAFGYLSSTTGTSVTFFATTAGTVIITAGDGETQDTATINVVPTSAPLLRELDNALIYDNKELKMQ